MQRFEVTDEGIKPLVKEIIPQIHQKGVVGQPLTSHHHRVGQSLGLLLHQVGNVQIVEFIQSMLDILASIQRYHHTNLAYTYRAQILDRVVNNRPAGYTDHRFGTGVSEGAQPGATSGR